MTDVIVYAILHIFTYDLFPHLSCEYCLLLDKLLKNVIDECLPLFQDLVCFYQDGFEGVDEVLTLDYSLLSGVSCS